MFIGSRFFAKNLGRWKPDYGILLDMVGDKDLTLPIEALLLEREPSVYCRLYGIAHQHSV